MKRWISVSPATKVLVPSLALLTLSACPLDDGTGNDTGSSSGVDTTPPPTSGPPTGGDATMGNDSTATSSQTSGPTTGPNPTTGPGDEVTIYDIQMGNVAENTIVTVTDVVVTSPVQVGEAGLTIQEQAGGEYSGIYVFAPGDLAAGLGVQPGDIVTVTGEYTEFFGFSELTIAGPDDVVVTGSTAVPDPVTVAASDIAVGGASAEAYEGVLVRVENVTASDATNMFGDFHVDSDLVVSSFFLFETRGGPLDVFPGTNFSFVQGPLLYNFDEFKVAPRTAADYDGVLDCATSATPATISEVRQGMFAENTLVLLQDVIVSTPLSFSGDLFFVQDAGGGAFSGISVYASDPTGLSVAPGDQVTICGPYTEFFDLSQIVVASSADVTVAGSGPAPAPEVLTPDVVGAGAMAEQWESVLVEVDNVTVTMEANMFGEWVVDDVLTTDDLFFDMASWPLPMLDDTFTSLTGVMTYSFGAYKLAPRTAADIVP